jgi:hypothetical protein
MRYQNRRADLIQNSRAGVAHERFRFRRAGDALHLRGCESIEYRIASPTLHRKSLGHWVCSFACGPQASDFGSGESILLVGKGDDGQRAVRSRMPCGTSARSGYIRVTRAGAKRFAVHLARHHVTGVFAAHVKKLAGRRYAFNLLPA